MTVRIKDKIKYINPNQYLDCSGTRLIEEDVSQPPREERGSQMYCPKCDFELEEGTFMKPICPECGEKLHAVYWKKGDRW